MVLCEASAATRQDEWGMGWRNAGHKEARGMQSGSQSLLDLLLEDPEELEQTLKVEPNHPIDCQPYQCEICWM